MINVKKLLSLALSGWLFLSMSAQAAEEQATSHHTNAADVTTLEKIDTQLGQVKRRILAKPPRCTIQAGCMMLLPKATKAENSTVLTIVEVIFHSCSEPGGLSKGGIRVLWV